MAKKQTTDLTKDLRAKGVRKGLAQEVGKLDGDDRHGDEKREEHARRAIDDLRSAADSIEERVLTRDPPRPTTKKAAPRKRTATKRMTKKAAPRKRTATKRTTKKAAPRKRTATKRTTKKAAPRKRTATKRTTKKAAPRKRTATKRTTKKAAPRKRRA